MSAEPLGFEPIWQAIKGWDIQREHGAGYHGPTGDDVRAILTALAAAGYAVVPVEPSVAMLQDGYDARLAARHPGVSGQTIDASMRATAYRELACYRAMLAAAKEPQA
jgi:hypothetical protein